MHITQKGYILARPDVTGKATHFFWSERPASGPNDLLVRAHDISFSVPDDFDYRAERINAACKVRADIQRRFEKDMEAINAQIDRLMDAARESEL